MSKFGYNNNKVSASQMAFNFSSSSVRTGDTVTTNLETVEKYLNEFFTNFDDTINRFKDNMVYHKLCNYLNLIMF